MALAGLAAAAGAGCTSASSADGTAAVGGQVERPPVGGDALLKALRFEEKTERRGSIELPAAHHRAEVDYKSQLIVVPDKDAIRRVFEANGGRMPVTTEAESARLAALEKVPALIEQAKSLASQASATLAAADARRREGTLDEAAIESTTELLRREADLRRHLLELAEAIVRDEVTRGPSPPTGDELELEIGRRLDLAVPDDAKFDFEWLRLQLPAAIHALRAQAVARGAAQESAQLALQISAELHSADESAALHVDNYDDIAEVFGAKSARVSLGNASEREQLRRELDAIDGLLRVGAEARDAKLSFVEGWKEWTTQLRAELDATLARLKAAGLDGNATPATIDGWIEQVIAGLDVDDPLAKEQRRQLEWLRSLSERLQRIVSVAHSLSVGVESQSLSGWLAVAADVRTLAGDVGGIVQDGFVRDLAGSLRLLAELGAKQSIAALQQTEFVARTQQQLLDSVAKFRQLAAPLADALVLVQARLAPEVVRQAVSGVEPVGQPRALDEIVDGTVRLDRSLADRGDEIDVSAAVYRRADGKWVRVDGATRTFVVDRFGLVSDLSADVAFISQRGTDHFRTAPSAAWTMHWRRRDTPDDSGWVDAWQLFDPGVGLSVVAISTDDESFQPGVGAHLSLFHDIVKVGGGVNLGADDDRDYWFVGIGLFEAIDGIGNLFGMRDKGGNGDS